MIGERFSGCGLRVAGCESRVAGCGLNKEMMATLRGNGDDASIDARQG